MDTEAELVAILSLLQYASLALDDLQLDDAKLDHALSQTIRETRSALTRVQLRETRVMRGMRRVQ